MAESINYAEIVQQMLGAARNIVDKKWNDVKPYAEKEFKAFAENLKMIAKLKLEGKITKEQAELYVNIQKNSIRIVLLTIEGLGILTVENIINAAIGIVRDTVNKFIGWKIV